MKWPSTRLRITLLYTGARINEVAQLKLNDIVQESGVWCIRIQKTIDSDDSVFC
jgi:integrase